MISLIIFDMDGVIADFRDIHFKSLNSALLKVYPSAEITKEEHLTTYDGLPTKVKLKMLSETKGLPLETHQQIFDLKQKFTTYLINNETEIDHRLVEVMQRLKKDGFTLCVASNSIRETVKLTLLRLGFMEYIDFFISNEDVRSPKPNAEIYLQCMIKAGVSPSETVILEDSQIGRLGAMKSKAHLIPVLSTQDVTYEKIKKYVDGVNESGDKKPKWDGMDMNLLIPMAGAGSRFSKAGYTFPKPLIEVGNKTMIQVVVDNLNVSGKYIFITQQEHYDKYNLKPLLNVISKGCEIITVSGLTEGAACTTLLAKEYINNDKPLLIANSDQFIEWDSNEFMYSMQGDNIDGGLLTFESTHPKWSYVKVDEKGYVTELREKEVISNIATVGIYYWSKGSDYVKYAEQMIAQNIRINNEFYVAPVYNEAIKDGKKFKTYNVDKMWGIGTPEDLNYFLKNKQNGSF